MSYTPSITLTFDEFIDQYGDNPHCELIDGELRDMDRLGRMKRWQADYAPKVEEYAFLGVPEYWIVDR